MPIETTYTCDVCHSPTSVDSRAPDLPPVGVYIPEVQVRPDRDNRYREQLDPLFICSGCTADRSDEIGDAIMRAITTPIGTSIGGSRGALGRLR